MHVNYCTVFDSNYIDKGLAMYYSLNRFAKNYSLYIFAFDEAAFEILNKKNLPNVCVLQEKELLDEETQRAKENRTRAEWCWTCSALSVDWLFRKYDLDNCVYIDSDLYFFSDPSIITEELVKSKKSVLITEHRFFPCLENRIILHMYGKYCVQFNAFINNSDGREVLSWWKEQCLRDCSGNKSYEVYGDQKYQDEFPKRFKCVYVMENQGGGLAPWNISQYRIDEKEDTLTVINKATGEKARAVFYHFQGFEILSGDMINMSVYKWKGEKKDTDLLKAIYGSYFYELAKIRNDLEDEINNMDEQSKRIRGVKKQKRRDSSMKRRIGQILVGLLSWSRVKLDRKKDYIHVESWR